MDRLPHLGLNAPGFGRADGTAGRLRSAALKAAVIAGSELLDESAIALLAQLPVQLDAAFSWAMLECRLSEDPRVDVVLHVDRDKRQVAGAAVPSHSSLGQVLQVWSNPRSPLSAVPTLTVEYDATPAGWSEPIVFAALESKTGGPPLASQEACALAVLAPSAEHSAAKALASCLATLPSGSWALHIASLAPRGRSGARLVVSIPPNSVASYLRRVDWPGDADHAGALAIRLGETLPRISIHLDLADSLGPNLGVELFYPGSPARDPRWAPAFAQVRAFAPKKVEALCRWPTREGSLVRLLGLKLNVVGNTCSAAKAYLAFREVPGA